MSASKPASQQRAQQQHDGDKLDSLTAAARSLLVQQTKDLTRLDERQQQAQQLAEEDGVVALRVVLDEELLVPRGEALLLVVRRIRLPQQLLEVGVERLVLRNPVLRRVLPILPLLVQIVRP